mgnify:CR=1 FL=1
MEKRGVVGGYYRAPKLPLTESHKNKIDNMLEKAGF